MAEETTQAAEPAVVEATPPTYSSDQLALAVAEGKIAVLKSVATVVNGVLDKANINSLDHGNVKMAFQKAAAVAEADGRAAIERMNPPDKAGEEEALASETAEIEPPSAPTPVMGPA